MLIFCANLFFMLPQLSTQQHVTGAWIRKMFRSYVKAKMCRFRCPVPLPISPTLAQLTVTQPQEHSSLPTRLRLFTQASLEDASTAQVSIPTASPSSSPLTAGSYRLLNSCKKSWNLPSNIDISSGKTAFFSQLQQVPYKWIFFVGQILYNLARMFAAHYESSWPPIWLPWVWKKKSLFWKKSLGKVLNFGSKNLYGPYKQNKQLVWSLFKDLSQLTPNEAGFFLKAWGRPE